MADGSHATSSSAAEEIAYNITSLQLKEAALLLKKESLNGAMAMNLQSSIESTFKLKGKWSSPGGHLKSFKNASESVIIK